MCNVCFQWRVGGFEEIIIISRLYGEVVSSANFIPTKSDGICQTIGWNAWWVLRELNSFWQKLSILHKMAFDEYWNTHVWLTLYQMCCKTTLMSVEIDIEMFKIVIDCKYCQTSNVRCTIVDSKLVDHSDVVGATPVGAAPTTSSFSASMDWAKAAARRGKNHLSFVIWYNLYWRFYDNHHNKNNCF